MLDIDPADLRLTRDLLARHLPAHDVRVFGSRVLGWPDSHGIKPHSDLDLVVMTSEPLPELALASLRADLEDSALPFRVDIVRHADLPDRLRALVEHAAEPLTPASIGPEKESLHV